MTFFLNVLKIDDFCSPLQTLVGMNVKCKFLSYFEVVCIKINDKKIRGFIYPPPRYEYRLTSFSCLEHN